MWTKYTKENPIPDGCFDQVYALLEEAFPENERRDKARQRALLDGDAYALYVTEREGSVVALIGAWEFETVRFLEHIAVGAALRGQGVGGKILQDYMAMAELPVVLEVEEPGASPFALRRIGMYERNGYHLNVYPYAQPPLNAGDPYTPMHLMSWPVPLEEERFLAVKEFLYKEVYHV